MHVMITNTIPYHTYALYIYSEIALEIINSDHWDKAMRMCNDNNVTPMRLLIEFMPGNHVNIKLHSMLCVAVKHPSKTFHYIDTCIYMLQWWWKEGWRTKPPNFENAGVELFQK